MHKYLPYIVQCRIVDTLVYRIDVQVEINVQVGKFLKNIKRAGQNKPAGGKNSGKSIIVQVGIFLFIVF
jgi:hypothetical protein